MYSDIHLRPSPRAEMSEPVLITNSSLNHPCRKVYAVIVGFNSAAWLETCLRSLQSSLLSDAILGIIYVDNASSDGSVDLVESHFRGVRVVRNSWNAGFAGGSNIGLEHALESGADYVLLVNPDTRTPPSLVQELVSFMDAWPEYGIVGPLQARYEPTATPSGLNTWSLEALKNAERHVFHHTFPEGQSAAGPEHGRAPRTLEHAYVQGAALFARASALRRIGLFDPAYHSYYEETDLCRRARWGGWRVALLLDLVIEHHEGGSSHAPAYRRLRMLRNRYYFLFTDPSMSVRNIATLFCRWIVGDLRRRGPVPAGNLPQAAADLIRGLAWCLSQSMRIASKRAIHRRLLSFGAGGPLVGVHGRTAGNVLRGGV